MQACDGYPMKIQLKAVTANPNDQVSFSFSDPPPPAPPPPPAKSVSLPSPSLRQKRARAATGRSKGRDRVDPRLSGRGPAGQALPLDFRGPLMRKNHNVKHYIQRRSVKSISSRACLFISVHAFSFRAGLLISGRAFGYSKYNRTRIRLESRFGQHARGSD